MKCWAFFNTANVDNPEIHEARRLCEAGQRMGHDVSILNPRLFDIVVNSAGEWAASYDGKQLERPDIIIPRTGAETTYFDLAVMRHFERLGVHFLNSSVSVETVADKLHIHQILAAEGIPTPKTILGKFPVDIDLIERELGFPVVVKTLKGTRGGGVYLSESRQNFNDLVMLIHESNPESQFLFQEYVKESHGVDIRALVIDGQVVAAMRRQSSDGGFKSNISLGGQGTPIDLSPEVRQLAVRTTKALGLDIAGVDILISESSYKICEANSAPGFKGLENATGMDIASEIIKAAKRHCQPANAGTSLWGKIFRKTSYRMAA